MLTIRTYAIIATWNSSDRDGATDGRHIIVDRVDHDERFVVAWQRLRDGTWATHWECARYCRTLSEAREQFLHRVSSEEV